MGSSIIISTKLRDKETNNKIDSQKGCGNLINPTCSIICDETQVSLTLDIRYNVIKTLSCH